MNDPAGQNSTDRRKRVFRVIALALPLLFFASLEGAARLLDLAPMEPLFVDGPPGYLRPNGAVVNRFFIHPSRAPQVSIDTTYFQRDKSDDLFRVVVQGGSSAAGFPYGKWASLAGMLEQRLRRIAPERTIEVIPTAMSAVNSYALLDFAQEIIAIEPDAVLIYAGHNEYLGVLGVGSALGGSHAPTVTRMWLAMRRSHLFRAMQHAYGAMIAAPPRERRGGTLMAQIAGDQAIPFGSQTFRSGVDQFSRNLETLLDTYERAGVPVLIGTLVSNESGHAPFIGAPGDTTSLAALRELDPAGSAEANDATQFFRLGRELLQAGRPADARRAFDWARDLDGLRFRAPSIMNRVIAETAAAHGATLVDIESALARFSPDGIVGDELMLEHLHPNLRGYFLLADAYFEALTATVEPSRWTAGPDRETAWREIPVTEVDALGGDYRLQFLKSDWPFQQEKQPVDIEAPRNEAERIAQDWVFGDISWLEAMQQALEHYQQIDRQDEAVKIALNLAMAFPFESGPQSASGRLLLAIGQPERGLAYLRRAAQMDPEDVDTWLALSEAYHATGRRQEAREALKQLLRLDPGNAEASRRLE